MRDKFAVLTFPGCQNYDANFKGRKPFKRFFEIIYNIIMIKKHYGRASPLIKLRKHNDYLRSDQEFKGRAVKVGQTVRVTYKDGEYDVTVGVQYFNQRTKTN